MVMPSRVEVGAGRVVGSRALLLTATSSSRVNERGDDWPSHADGSLPLRRFLKVHRHICSCRFIDRTLTGESHLDGSIYAAMAWPSFPTKTLGASAISVGSFLLGKLWFYPIYIAIRYV